MQNEHGHAEEGKATEWFGGTAPAHEAATAYGLLQFRDMAKVSEVDAKTDRADAAISDGAAANGKGGFKRKSAGYARHVRPRLRRPHHRTPTSSGALTEGSPDDDVTKELDALAGAGENDRRTRNTGRWWRTVSINRSRHTEARRTTVEGNLAELQKDDGHLDAAQTRALPDQAAAIYRSRRRALSILAWLKANNPAEFTANTVKAVQWIGQQRGGYGGFGSTQSTILALKALIAFTKENKKTAEAGELDAVSSRSTQVGKLASAAGAAKSLHR